MSRVARLDLGARIRDELRTVQGGAKVSARCARTGVQRYQQADGSVIREYRPASEIFAPSSLASWKTATVTIGHPTADVSPSNWKDHAIGFLLDPHEEDGRYVAADIVIQDAEALRRINLDASDANALRELSAGYTCELRMEPGVAPDGEHYDAVQTSVIINHVGLGSVGWGRAGNAVALKLDGGVCVLGDCSPGCPCTDCKDSTDAPVLVASREEGTRAFCRLVDRYGVPASKLFDKSDAYLVERERAHLAAARTAMIDELVRSVSDRKLLERCNDDEIEDLFRRRRELDRRTKSPRTN